MADQLSVSLITVAPRVYEHPFWKTCEVIEKLPRESFDDVTTRLSPRRTIVVVWIFQEPSMLPPTFSA